MKILISSYVLNRSGTPTYTLTLYNELLRRGHDVTVYSPQMGTLAKQMNAVDSLSGSHPDVIIAQMNICAVTLRSAFPNVPMIFSAHGIDPVSEQPPEVEVQWYTAINEDVRDNLVLHGIGPERITIVRDFIDTDLFRPVKPVNDEPQIVLFISNYKKWRTHAVINRACKKLRINYKAIGSPYGPSHHVEWDINKADLVVSVARGILEAMACGRPVISFDIMRGDGYVTPELYFESRTRNFGGRGFDRKCLYSFNADTFVAEIKKYSADDGIINRDIILEHHNHVKGVDSIMSIINNLYAGS